MSNLDYRSILIFWKQELGALFLCVCLLLAFQVPAAAELNADLNDVYLESNFDWAMFVDARDVKHYMNYEGSLLKPLTNVRVYRRVFSHTDDNRSDKPKAQVYEEFWYHKKELIGLRRRNPLNIDKDRTGTIVVGKSKPGS